MDFANFILLCFLFRLRDFRHVAVDEDAPRPVLAEKGVHDRSAVGQALPQKFVGKFVVLHGTPFKGIERCYRRALYSAQTTVCQKNFPAFAYRREQIRIFRKTFVRVYCPEKPKEQRLNKRK